MRKIGMVTLKCLTDPLGHIIFISTFRGKCKSPEILITDPTFIIQLGHEEIYYFREIEWEMNVLFAIRNNDTWYKAESFTQQPTTGYVSLLLKKGGRVISFL